ncbi:MAG: ROK family protein [Anaerolineales bacterium]
MDHHTRTITSFEMRGINRTAILELIRREGPISRTEIARRLQVSVPTVLRIMDELVADKLVHCTGEKEWSGGRRRELVELNKADNLTIGVDLGGTKFYGAVADLGGNILFEDFVYQHGTKGEESYRLLVKLIHNLLDKINQTPHPIIRGVGVGAPGITSMDGVIQNAPSLEWNHFPLAERLRQDFELPVVVDNDVNLAALGELWFGEGQNYDHFVLINIGTGLGAGVVLDGALYRGAHQSAGEIGYMMPGREYLEKNYPGFGAMELLTAGFGIAERARQKLSHSLSPDELINLSAVDVFEAYRRGEPWSNEIVDTTVDYLAVVVINLIAMFDPQLIILGGGVSRSADILLPRITERVMGRIPIVPQLTASKLGLRGAALGAVASLIYQTSNTYIVRKLA